jgi:hypothetical protein
MALERELGIGNAVLNGTYAWTDNMSNATGYDNDVTITGAAVGDFVLVSPSMDLDGCQISAHVSAANTVTIAIFNHSGGVLNSDFTIYIKVIRRTGLVV